MTICPWCGRDSKAKPNARGDYMCLRCFFKFRTTPAPPGDPWPAPPPKLPMRRPRCVVQPTRTSQGGRPSPLAPRPRKREWKAGPSHHDSERRATVRYTDIDTARGDQLEVTTLDGDVMLGVAEAFAAGWQHAVMRPQQALELAALLTDAAKTAERADGH
jgi:hypothetical protein